MTASTSAEPAPEVRITVRAGSPLAEVFLIDHRFALVRRSIGDLETTVAPGVYKIKAKLADAETERLVLCETDQEIDLAADLQMRSPAPWPRPGDRVRARVSWPAPWRSTGAGFEAAPAQAMLMTTRASGQVTAPQAALYDAAGIPASLQSLTESAGWDVTGVDPGSYFLRWRGTADVEVEQAIQIIAGWQTQIFLRQETSAGVVDLCSTRVSILMSRGGFEPESDDLRRTEEARTALANERKVATETLEAIVEESESPMLALYGAHLMLLTRDPRQYRTSRNRPQATTRFDEPRFARIVARLREDLGRDHPDVVALSTQLPGSAPERLEPVGAPPMLWRSWLLLIEASNDTPDLVGREIWSRVVAPLPLYPFLIWATQVPDAVESIEQTLARALADDAGDEMRRSLTDRLVVPRAVIDDVAERR